MIARFFKKRREPLPGPVGAIPDGQRIYAIGDIHGRLDLLDALLAQVEADDSARLDAETQIIFLGDLIDRGDESAQVVERAIALAANSKRYRFLLGNHEELLLKALHGEKKALTIFSRVGGRETCLSYGISEEEYLAADYDKLLDLLRDSVPQSHIAFLEGFEDLIVIGDYAFVHAGIRPGAPLAQQQVSDLRWIRKEFLAHTGEHEKIIVHGHTITEHVDYGAHRIGLDTGAYSSGKLTAMGFEGDQRWELATG